MPAVCVAHGRMKTEHEDDDARRQSGTSKSAKRKSTKGTNPSRLPPGLITKTGAAELTLPHTLHNKKINRRSVSDDQRVMERLLTSKLFGHLSKRQSSEDIRAARQNSRLGRFIQSAYFKIGITVLICLSAVQMGLATDINNEGAQIYWDVCEQVFTTVFAIEVTLKMFVDGMSFFLDAWNIIDFFIAFSSALDAWVLPLSGVDANIGFIRTFRLLRLLRIMRMLRIIPEILMVMEGIGASLRSLFWIIILLVAVLYACSIMCVEMLGKSEDGFPGYSEEVDDLLKSSRAYAFNNYMFFGTVTRSMVSLLGIVFLAEWDVIVRPVYEKFPAMILMFAFIVVLMTLGVLNIIVGVIVENTTQAMEKERRIKVEESKARKMQFIEELSSVFENIDEDKDGALSWYECQKAALRGDQKLAQLVYDIDFPPGITFEEIFQMLDVDASGAITQDEFINGMFRIVHCDTFQRDCLHYLAVGRIMSKMNNDKVEIVNSIRHEVRRAMQEVLNGDEPRKGYSDSPTKCMSPVSISPVVSLRGDSATADASLEYSTCEQDDSAHGHQEFLHKIRQLSPTRDVEPIYDPLMKAEMVSRLYRAAKDVENKLGALFSILHEEQYYCQLSSRIDAYGSEKLSSMHSRPSPDPSMVEFRTGALFAAHGDSNRSVMESVPEVGQDTCFQWDPNDSSRTKLRLSSCVVGKASTNYTTPLQGDLQETSEV